MSSGMNTMGSEGIGFRYCQNRFTRPARGGCGSASPVGFIQPAMKIGYTQRSWEEH
jgi:hypothetical protein